MQSQKDPEFLANAIIKKMKEKNALSGLSRVKLFHLMFMADSIALAENGEKIISENFIRGKNGPELLSGIQFLKDFSGDINEEIVSGMALSGQKIIFSFPSCETEKTKTINECVQELGHLEEEEIKRYVSRYTDILNPSREGRIESKTDIRVSSDGSEITPDQILNSIFFSNRRNQATQKRNQKIGPRQKH